jgi:hypothetical protein
VKEDDVVLPVHDGSRFNGIHVQLVKLTRHLDLFLKIQGTAIARGLFAQRHIDDLYLSHGRLLTTFAIPARHRAGHSRLKDCKPLIYYLNGRLSSGIKEKSAPEPFFFAFFPSISFLLLDFSIFCCTFLEISFFLSFFQLFL